MKKFLSLVLALVMALSLTTVAWGAGATTEGEVQTAFTNGENVVLSNDITVTGTLTVPATKTVVLDLNGKVIYYAGTDPLFDVKGNLTVKNGTINSTGSCVLFYGNNGSTANKGTSEAVLTLDGLNVTAAGYIVYGNTAAPAWKSVTVTGGNYTTSGAGFVYDMAWDGVVTMTGVTANAVGTKALVEVAGYGNATATITDCTFTSAGTGVLGYAIGASYGAQVTINGGTYVGADIVAQAHETTYNGGPVPTVTINSGSFTGKLENNPAGVGEGEIVITGGTFDDASAEDYLATGLTLTAGGVVVPKGGSVVTSKAYKMTSNGVLMAGDKNAIFCPAVAAVLNDDGKQTNTANIAYYSFEGANYVVAASLADADVVLYSDAEGKNVMMYLKETVVSYDGTGAVFTNFGKACGQVTYTAEAGKTYYTTNANGDAGIYVADAKGTKALMVGGRLVLVKDVPVAYTTAAVKHAAVPTVKDGKVTGYTCATCKLVAIEAPNFMSIPKGATQDGLTGNWYWPAAVVTPSTDKTVTSADTFDAGIAMYVGMSVMAAAGSAVVIGKKKD